MSQGLYQIIFDREVVAMAARLTDKQKRFVAEYLGLV